MKIFTVLTLSRYDISAENTKHGAFASFEAALERLNATVAAFKEKRKDDFIKYSDKDKYPDEESGALTIYEDTGYWSCNFGSEEMFESHQITIEEWDLFDFSENVTRLQTHFGEMFVDAVISEDDKVRIYDSDNRFTNYIEGETVRNLALLLETSPAEYIARFCDQLRVSETLEDLLAEILEGYVLVAKDKNEVAEFDPARVNRIGDYYIALEENV